MHGHYAGTPISTPKNPPGGGALTPLGLRHSSMFYKIVVKLLLNQTFISFIPDYLYQEKHKESVTLLLFLNLSYIFLWLLHHLNDLQDWELYFTVVLLHSGSIDS